MERMKELKPGCNVPDLVSLTRASPEVTPEEVPEILNTMQEASVQLSQLAERTIGYQLNVIKAYFTSQAARLLPETDATFWSEISQVFSRFAQFCESDYVFFSMLKRPTDDYMTVATAIPGSALAAKTPKIPKTHFFPLRDRKPGEATLLKPAHARRLLFDSPYLFDSPCYVLPLEVQGPLGLIIIGDCKRKGLQRLGATQLQFIQEQFKEISIVLESRRQLQARDELLADLSHEVKAPLAAVLAVAENLAANRIEYVAIESTATRMLARLRRLQMSVDRFRMLERLLANSESFARNKVSIYDVAKECEREYGGLAAEKDINLRVSNELSNLSPILTDREAFKHALGNLIDNAIKYGNLGTDVVIEGRMMGTETKLDVRDIGIPLEAEDTKFLGMRGFRTIAARKRDPSGTGIGFTMIDGFLRLMGGRFEVHSLPFGSNSFHVIISLFLPR
jgi:signal transduction histidine kinase